jgi:hypothetical protein
VERLPEPVASLYKRLFDNGQYRVTDQCQLLGHEVNTETPDPEWVGHVVHGCTRCGLLRRGWQGVWFSQADVVVVRQKKADSRKAWLAGAEERTQLLVRERKFSDWNGAVFTALEHLLHQAAEGDIAPVDVLAGLLPEVEPNRRLAEWIQSKTGCKVIFWFTGGDESEPEGPRFEVPDGTSGRCEMPDHSLWDCLKGKTWEGGTYRQRYSGEEFATASEPASVEPSVAPTLEPAPLPAVPIEPGKLDLSGLVGGAARVAISKRR